MSQASIPVLRPASPIVGAAQAAAPFVLPLLLAGAVAGVAALAARRGPAVPTEAVAPAEGEGEPPMAATEEEGAGPEAEAQPAAPEEEGVEPEEVRPTPMAAE